MTTFPPFPSSPSLWTAVAVSLALHAAVLFSGAMLFSSVPPIPRIADALRVKLVEPPPAPPPQPAFQPASQPALLKREDTPRKAVTTPLQKPQPPRLVRQPGAGSADTVTVSRELRGEAARKASEQIARQLFYPADAIARGLEGETLVLLFLDESGNAIAARVESSSGHAMLDEAAVRAARTLRSLPAAAPREAVVPVRFRLR